MNKRTKSILWISPNGKWEIARMPAPYHFQGFYVRVASDTHADYPVCITVDRGRDAVLLWDRPESVPAYVQKHANKILIPLLREGSV